MLKSFLQFMGTGVVVIGGYATYFVAAALITFIVGLPIGLGVYLVNDAIKYLFSGV